MNHDAYYILGYAYDDLEVSEDRVVISKPRYNKDVMEQITQKYYGPFTTLRAEGKNLVFTTRNVALYDFLKEKKASSKLPRIDEDYFASFACGLWDAYGDLSGDVHNPCVRARCNHADVIDFLAGVWETKTPHVDKIQTFGYKALDLCGKMYANVGIKDNRRFDQFLDWLNWIPQRGWAKETKFSYQKLHPDAVAPWKARVTDTAWDVSAIKLEKVKGDIYKADTCLAIKPAPGLYFDLVGRSSLASKGWHFLLGVGVIDRSYQGGIVMTLQKLDDRDLPELPFRCGQLIPRNIVHAEWEEVKDLGHSDRGVKGFGSSDRS